MNVPLENCSYFMVDEVADITFNHSMKILMDAMIESLKAIFQATEEQITRFTDDFIGRLPDYMRKPLLAANNA